MANRKTNKPKIVKRFPFGAIAVIALIYLLIASLNMPLSGVPREISYSEFYNILKDSPGKIKSVTKIESMLHGEFEDSSKFFLHIPDNDTELLNLLRQNVLPPKQRFEVKPPRTLLANLLYSLGPVVLLIFFWWMMAARGEQLGNRIMSFGKMRPKMHSEKEDEKATFRDVAGVDEAKEELQEVIEFLKDPLKFQKLGGKIPKGVLLVGPPGTGKTLLARAVAGEAGVPFYSISGSDFVEMFVGVGASVSADTPILIKTDLKTQLMSISEFVDAYYKNNEEGFVIPIDGIKTLGFEELNSKFKGSNKKFFGYSSWKNISGVYRHWVEKIYEVHYLGGVIRATGDHSIFVRTRDGIKVKPVSELRRGEVLVNLPFKNRGVYSPESGTPHQIRAHRFSEEFFMELDIWNDDQELKDDYAFALGNQGLMSQNAIATTIGVSQATVGNWQRGVHLPQLLSRKSLKLELPQKVQVTKELMKLFGYYTAEGRVNHYVEFIFGAHEEEIQKDCIKLMREIFGLEPALEATADNTLRIKYYSAPLGRFFEAYCSTGSKNKYVPSFMWDSPRDYFLSYLEGYSKGDGYITKEGKVSITSVSYRLITELTWLCSMHGIKTGVRKLVLKGGRVIKNKPLPDGVAWNLIIGKTANPFREEVLFPNQLKKPYVKEIKEVPYNSYVYDLCGCENEAFFGGEQPILLHNSRVRDLFEQGRRAAKTSGKGGAIIFIDEIDAVGRLRFSGIGGGHDEREQTLNALLVEMDGFDTAKGLILIAATNRPDTLDPALLRPGRFDRTIIVNLPDIKGREEILEVHTRKIKLSPSVDLKSIASQTPGFSGADIANLCNEAALLAARHSKEAVEMVEFEKSVERVLMGPEKKSHIMSKKEKEITAFHESGHSLLSLLLPEVNPLKKVSIIPRGLAGGYTFTPPLEDRHYWTKKELMAEIALMLGGRASEELNLNEVTTGAQNDLEMATHMARRMVMQFGMSDRLGHVTLGRREGLIFLGRDIMEEKNYSEETARLIDEEVKRIVDEAYARAKVILQENLEKLKALSNFLLEKEVMDGEEVKRLVGIQKADTK